MEEVGIVRRIDKLGRIIIPKEFRDFLNVQGNDLFGMTIVDDKIVIHRIEQKIDYEKIIKILLCSKNRKNYENYVVDKKSISELKKIIDNFIDDLIEKKDIK